MCDTAAVRVLVVAQSHPRFPRQGVDLRLAALVRALPAPTSVEVVSLVPPATAQGGAAREISFEWLRRSDGLPSDRWDTPAVRERVAGVIAEQDPHLVVLAQLWTHRFLELARGSGRLVVLDAYNAEGPLHRQLAATAASDVPRPLATRLAEHVEAAEARVVAGVDEVWACSEVDAERLRAYPGCRPVRVVPNAVELPDLQRLPPREPRTVLFPGAFGYPPNSVAATWLACEVLPLLNGRFVDARLVLMGSDPSSPLRRLADEDPRVTVTGSVESAAEYFARASVVAVPLRTGGGTRFKVLEAFAAGAVVVSTATGVEGLAVRDGEHHLAAETAQEFADAITAIWTRPSLAASLRRSAATLVADRYGTVAVQAAVGPVLAQAAARRAAWRPPGGP